MKLVDRKNNYAYDLCMLDLAVTMKNFRVLYPYTVHENITRMNLLLVVSIIGGPLDD